MDATSRAIVVHDPELTMNMESIKEHVDILSFTIFQLLQNLDFVDSNFHGIIFGAGVGLIVCCIDIDDLKGNNTVVHLIVAKEDMVSLVCLGDNLKKKVKHMSWCQAVGRAVHGTTDFMHREVQDKTRV